MLILGLLAVFLLVSMFPSLLPCLIINACSQHRYLLAMHYTCL